MAASQAALLLLLLLVGQFVALAASAPINLAANGYDEKWLSGRATWYGDPQGEGSSGGACGYTKLTGTPIGNKIAAGNAPIYQNGKGCGQCYDVKCSYPSCKSTATRVVITDLCPGGTYCSTDNPAFDLSGAAISAMATDGQDGALRNIGLYEVQYKRVPCSYPSQNVALQVDAGSSKFWLSFTVKYLGGPGGIESVQISQNGGSFQPAQHNWGANWQLINYSGQAFKGPYSVKITALLNGHSVTAIEVIPENFNPGQLYESRVQMKY